MRSSSPSIRRRRGVALATLLALGAVSAGCGSIGHDAGNGDRVAGKELFTQRCGSCHTLADAGTTGTIGPNLDDAFARSRADGLGQSTFVQVVRDQIYYPITNPPTGEPGMPSIDDTLPTCAEDASEAVPGCVRDQEQAASDIAAYVATVAGTASPEP